MVLSTITGDQQQSSLKSVVSGEERPLPRELRLHRVFEQALADHPEAESKTAISFQDARKTYREVNASANLLARVILDRSTVRFDVREGRTPLVAVCMEPSDKLVISLLAILKTGAAYVALDPTFPPNRISHILESSRPALILCEAEQPIALQQALVTTEATKKIQVI